MKEVDTGPVVALQLCMDDQWLTVSSSLQVDTDELSPTNLQLTSISEGLLLSWERPHTESGITSYDVACSTLVQSSSGEHLTSISVTVDGGTTSTVVSVLTTPASYNCCVTANTEGSGGVTFSSETCGTTLFDTLASESTGDSILVPVLGVVVGVLFSALVIVSVALVIFMTTSGKQRKGDTENLEQERKE